LSSSVLLVSKNTQLLLDSRKARIASRDCWFRGGGAIVSSTYRLTLGNAIFFVWKENPGLPEIGQYSKMDART